MPHAFVAAPSQQSQFTGPQQCYSEGQASSVFTAFCSPSYGMCALAGSGCAVTSSTARNSTACSPAPYWEQELMESG
jgi:hypothetical protein